MIADRAAAVIFVHNHPSGELDPSDADLRIHDQLTEAGKILGLRVLDHVIVSRRGYYSFQEGGRLPREHADRNSADAGIGLTSPFCALCAFCGHPLKHGNMATGSTKGTSLFCALRGYRVPA